MRKTYFTLALLCICLAFTCHAQLPRNYFNFQGVARDAAGKVVANQNVSVRLGIHPLLNPYVFREKHSVQTNAHGIFTLQVGSGELISGNFFTINWQSGSYQINIEIDITGGENYVSLGSTQLLSVPYAIHAKQADGWKDYDAIVQSGDFQFGPPLPDQLPGTRLIWYPKKAAFRAGLITGNAWNNVNIGEYTTAFGYNTQASGQYAFAVGAWSLAGGEASFAAGNGSAANATNSMVGGLQNQANGESAFSVGSHNNSKGNGSATIGIQNIAHAVGSIATGNSTQASGDGSFSSGQNTFAKAFGSATFGAYNNLQDNPVGATSADARDADRIFQIGNGGGPADLSNALTVLRSGNIGVGNGVLIPQFILDIGGRPRVRHGAETAGIFFDDSEHNPNAFVGMRNNSEVGFYLGQDWRFYVNAGGGATLVGALDQVSDRRLKKDFSQLTNSLDKISKVTGYHYRWTNKKLSENIQTGVIAQEIEAIFPELVSTNAEGYKAVNYIGLIPHLIESVKDLKAENEELKKTLGRVAQLEASMGELLKIAGEKRSPEAQVK
ncbi:hypothetical protein DYBT9623_01501 [Dyadobacter sp. CECT 9623]|uniref:Peptidase S74 domain-containing protein n=1 Tax=Dyadobacter linearis TaxID=2823330 RepID=A0ABN7R5Q7_9BACT|nr:tail fiber domain-containing protein [Dyadobacter sp. CECT 9623]CAG5068769.1 hypothetical protein DYBT9623_01501 [Dyadobacter sp. CECT 9623]